MRLRCAKCGRMVPQIPAIFGIVVAHCNPNNEPCSFVPPTYIMKEYLKIVEIDPMWEDL
jgi:hypothetical protein